MTLTRRQLFSGLAVLAFWCLMAYLTRLDRLKRAEAYRAHAYPTLQGIPMRCPPPPTQK